MKKTLLKGLVIAITVLSFTACSNLAPDKGTEPSIDEAFFASEIVESDNSYHDTFRQKRITSLSFNQNPYLVLSLEDPDKDIVEIQISTDRNFGYYWHWTDLEYVKYESFWTVLMVGWKGELDDNSKSRYSLDKGVVYVMAIDDKGNESKIYSIYDVTITE